MGFFHARWFTKVAVPTSPHQHSHNRNASQKPLNICVNVNTPTYQPSLDPFRYRHSIRHSSVFSPHTSFSPPSRIPHPPPDPSALPHYSASSIISPLSDRLPHPPHPPNHLFLCHPLPLLIPVTPPAHLQHLQRPISTTTTPPPPPLHPSSLPEYHIPYNTQPTPFVRILIISFGHRLPYRHLIKLGPFRLRASPPLRTMHATGSVGNFLSNKRGVAVSKRYECSQGRVVGWVE